VAGLDSNDGRRRKMAGELQLARYIQSMVRAEEDTYQSRELVPNAIFELFARDAPHLTPKHWPSGRLPEWRWRKGSFRSIRFRGEPVLRLVVKPFFWMAV
jgi:hypothetical protein